MVSAQSVLLRLILLSFMFVFDPSLIPVRNFVTSVCETGWKLKITDFLFQAAFIGMKNIHVGLKGRTHTVSVNIDCLDFFF